MNPHASAVELWAAIKSKEVSSVELKQMYIDRTEKYDDKINAVVVHDFERGLEAAAAADTAVANGDELGPLQGVSMTIKEAYDIKGLPTTWGIPEMKDNIATSVADYIQRLKGPGRCFSAKRTCRSTWRIYRFLTTSAAPRATSGIWDAHPVARRGVPPQRWGGTDRAGSGLRYRRIDPQPGALLWDLRSQTEMGGCLG